MSEHRTTEGGTKVYIVVEHDYESTAYGPVFETHDLAEQFAKLLGGRYEVEEFELLSALPARVTKHYAQMHRNEVVTGSADWWDYELPLPQTELMFWADSEAEAVAGLKRMQSA